MPGPTLPRFTLLLTPTPGVLPDDPMSEAGRKILFHQFEIMLKHEPDARTGKDIEAVHDMRVATRRMRSAIRIFGGSYKKSSPLFVFSKSLKRLAATLGAVRDLDVFRDKLDAYIDTLPESARDGFQPLQAQIKDDLHHARQALDKALESERHARFIETFHAFLTTSGAGAVANVEGTPYLVQHVVPPLIYERYMAMRMYETFLDSATLDALHMLRIEGKQLRYSLEFFSEVLGSDVQAAIEAVKALQDHLGDLQDARVASDKLQDYIQSADDREDVTPVLQYMAAREDEKNKLLNGVPTAWKAFTAAKTRRAVALSVAAL